MDRWATEADLYTYKAIVRRVIDGDSVVLDVSLGCGMWLNGERCRLSGINSPEVTGATKDYGVAATEHLRSLLPQNDECVLVRTLKDRKCKWGRWLVEIWVAEVNINQRMIQDGYAIPYDEG